MLPQIPAYRPKTRTGANGKKEIFDQIRRKYVALTEEELVRQECIHFLMSEKHIPAGNISVERGLKVMRTVKRTDIVVYNRSAKAVLIVECKAPSVKITQDVFDQIARYNLSLQVDYLIVTNGSYTCCCKINFAEQSYNFLEEIPDWEQLNYM